MGNIKKILVSQQKPSNTAIYTALEEKYGVSIDFIPFFLIEPLESREFRAQRLNILDYTAIVFSSRHAIDAFFSLSNELRVKIPETMKYFCTTEAIAMYLQKHIVYRKRKIFFGDGTPSSVLAQIGTKHNAEKFLITTSSSSKSEPFSALFSQNGIECTTGMFVKNVSQNLKDLKINDYNLIVMYNPADVKSLFENFSDYRQGDTKFISFGKGIVDAMEEAGLSIEIKAPSPEVPSAARAIEIYLEKHKK